MNPAVSVIIPLYNSEQYIADTVVSVQQQSFTDWELIIIDDGSTDFSVERVNPFLVDQRIRLVQQVNHGVSHTRNRGIDMAIGMYITFLDADDLMLPANLEKKVKFLRAVRSVQWVFSNRYEFHDNHIDLMPSLSGKGKDVLRNILLWNGEVVPGPCSNILVTKDLIMNSNIRFDEHLSTAADQDFSIQLASKSEPGFIEEPLWCYRHHCKSMSRTILLMEKDHMRVYSKCEQLNLFPTLWFRRQCFANLYVVLAGSWWINGENKWRGTLFMFWAIAEYPPVIFKLVTKLFK